MRGLLIFSETDFRSFQVNRSLRTLEKCTNNIVDSFRKVASIVCTVLHLVTNKFHDIFHDIIWQSSLQKKMPVHFSHNYPTCSSISWPIGSSSLFPFPRTEQDPSFIVSRSFNECLFRPLSRVTVILAIVWSSGKVAISEDSNCARSDLVKARSGFRGCERSFGVRRA